MARRRGRNQRMGRLRGGVGSGLGLGFGSGSGGAGKYGQAVHSTRRSPRWPSSASGATSGAA